MNEKEQFDAYSALADFRMKRWMSRRDLIWKVTFGVWAFIVGGSIYGRVGAVPSWIIALITCGFYLGFVMLWLKPMFEHDKFDRNLAWRYMKRAERILEPDKSKRIDQSDDPPVPTSSWAEFFHDKMVWFQLIATAVLLALQFTLVAPKSN